MNKIITGLLLAISQVFLGACVQIQAVQPKVAPLPSELPARIVFDSDHDGNREIYIMDADGSDQTRLTNDPGHDKHPVWSPGVGEVSGCRK